ncbi:LysR family transcriptional regulator [uncultured Shewanella sp.]|uniref:LysR family transcriptional regulator n=1 Tax=uncultured Shewanella sp. TaxID=173975 RepID=UPI0026137C43|nr:LysR family transcriptional regulator [uncultured Shewanella sp.]
MSPNPLDMMTFLEVAEAQSFTAAAEKLGRTTSAVSQAVNRLEKDLNCRLFYRTTRSLSLTDAGVHAISYCRQMQDVYQSAKTKLQNIESEPSGLFSITAPHILSRSLIVPTLTRYCDIYPDLSIKLVTDDNPIDIVEKQIDLSIRIGEPSSASARMTKVGVLTKGLYASRDYVTGKGGIPISFSQLENWDHIASGWQGSPIIYTGPGKDRIKITPRYTCNTVYDVLSFTVSGAGVGLLPDVAAREHLHQGALHKLCDLFPVPVYAVHQYERRAPLKVKNFVSMLKAEFKTRLD